MWRSVISITIFILTSGNFCYDDIPSYYIRIYKYNPEGGGQRVGAATLFGNNLIVTSSSVINSENNASEYYLMAADGTERNVQTITDYNHQHCSSFLVFLIPHSPISSPSASISPYGSPVPIGGSLTVFDDTQQTILTDGYIDLIKCTDSDICIPFQLKTKNLLGSICKYAVGGAIVYDNQYVGTLVYQGDWRICSIKGMGF